MTTIIQPFQCDLQPQIQETHRTTHTGTTIRCRTQRRNQFATETTAAATAAHTRYDRRLQPLYTEKCKLSCSVFFPKTKPIEHSCSHCRHCNAFCSITWLTRISLHAWQHQMTTIMQPFQCDLQPKIQETHRITQTDTTTRCSTRKITSFRAPASSPKQSPLSIHAATTMRFAASRG